MDEVTLKVGDVVEVVNTGEYIVGVAQRLENGIFYVRLDKKYQNSIALKIRKSDV